jgi:hypothetical protein
MAIVTEVTKHTRKGDLDMKRLSAVILAAIVALVLLAPAPSFAWHGGRRVVYHHGYNGAAIAAGVLGGIATGIFLDRVFFPPPAPVVVEPAYPPPAPRDPYDSGYSDGYNRGLERGRYERYEQGKNRGYDEGYEDARRGRY